MSALFIYPILHIVKLFREFLCFANGGVHFLEAYYIVYTQHGKIAVAANSLADIAGSINFSSRR